MQQMKLGITNVCESTKNYTNSTVSLYSDSLEKAKNRPMALRVACFKQLLIVPTLHFYTMVKILSFVTEHVVQLGMGWTLSMHPRPFIS